jgi:hypothetical protein
MGLKSTEAPVIRDYGRSLDRVAGAGCIATGLLMLLGTVAMLWQALTDCPDPRHGCLYAITGAPVLAIAPADRRWLVALPMASSGQ